MVRHTPGPATVPAAGPAAAATEAEPPSWGCADALTTPEVAACLARQLQESDRRLAAALEAVRRSALSVPSADFPETWRRFVVRYGGGELPERQLRRFQAERRRLCVYAWSLSLQGTGFGSFVTGCELALNRTLIRELTPR